jgi:hypothetical protein
MVRDGLLYRNVSMPYSDKQVCIDEVYENIPDTLVSLTAYWQG